MPLRKFKGLALTVDLAVVIVCICILLAAGFVGIYSILKTAKINKARAETASLALAVAQYAYDLENAYPDYTAAQCLPDNLVVLESKHTDSGKGPWLSENEFNKSGTTYLDPWGNAYVYTHGSGDDGRFVVYSKGPDGNGSVTTSGVVSSNGIGASGGLSR